MLSDTKKEDIECLINHNEKFEYIIIVLLLGENEERSASIPIFKSK